MGHEITHMGIIDRFLSLGFPGLKRRLIVGENAHNVDLGQVAELGAAQISELTAKDEMEELLALCCHGLPVWNAGPSEGSSKSKTFKAGLEGRHCLLGRHNKPRLCLKKREVSGLRSPGCPRPGPPAESKVAFSALQALAVQERCDQA